MKTWTKLTHKVIEVDPAKGTATIEFTESITTRPIFIFFWMKPEVRSETVYREKYIRGEKWPGHWRSRESKFTYYRVKDLQYIDAISYPRNPEPYSGPQFGFRDLDRIFANARHKIAAKAIIQTLETRVQEI